LALMEEDNDDCGIITDSPAEIKLFMDRRLNTVQKKAVPTIKQPKNNVEYIADIERFSKLLNTSFIDRKKVWQKIEDVLKLQQTATLKEIIEKKGLDNGPRRSCQLL